jgi:pimeloyl-ACP methyl ester carboxylesterase
MSNSPSPVILLPGFLCDQRLWKFQKILWASRPSMIIDLRHCKTLTEMVHLVEPAPYERFILVGFSMGAYVAQVFATQYPTRIEQLVLIGATGSSLPDVEIKGRMQMKSILQHSEYKGLSERELKHYLHPKSFENTTIKKTVQEMTASNTSEMYLGQMIATLEREDYKATLNSLHFPITMIVGDEDKITLPQEVELFHQAIPRSQLFRIPECGHFVPLEKPEELNQILLKHVL